MAKVSQTGSFRASLIDWGVGVTPKAELPQLNIQVALTEIYDTESGEWLDYSEQNETLHGFFCLRDKQKKSTLNAKQAMKIFGWDGGSYRALAEGDYGELTIQVRIDDADMDAGAKYPYEMAWIDVEDAVPGGMVKKMDANELDALDKKFAVQLKKDSKGQKKAAGRPSSPSDKTAKDKPQLETAGEGEETDKQKQMRLKAEKNQARVDAEEADKAAKKEKPKVRPRPGAKKEEVAECTDAEAWAAICAHQDEIGADDDHVNDLMIDVSREVGGVTAEDEEPDTDAFTKEQWAKVRDTTISKMEAPESE